MICQTDNTEQVDQNEGGAVKADIRTRSSRGRIGYSDRINDPTFAKYVKNSNRWAGIFTAIITVAAVVGFYIAGEMGVDDMSNPEALYIGFGIGGMFLLIGLSQIIGRKRSKTWDGEVVDKTQKRKKERVTSGNEDYWRDYTEYIVQIRSENGKRHAIRVRDDDTVYNYYKVGDKVRHHAGLNSYEKYDKSNDDIVFCAACATLCGIEEDVCFRCQCPLLK